MWNVAQAAVQGRGHLSQGVPCQDKTIFIKKNGACAIALADGAGSAKFSHHGAERAVECISNLLVDNFDYYYAQEEPDIVRQELLSHIKEELEALSKSIGCDIKELASTLLSVAVCENRYLIFHLGDGVIGYHDGDRIKVATSPINGEFCNTTVFTTTTGAEGAIKLIKGEVWSDMKGFVMFSDGVESILYIKNQNEISQSLSPVFDDLSLLDCSEVENNLIETLNEIKSHTQDDCSIIVMSKSSRPENPMDENDRGAGKETEPDPVPFYHRKYVPTIVIVGTILIIAVIIFILVYLPLGHGRS